MLGLEGERAVLLGVLLVQAAQVSQLLDHLGVEEAPAWVVDPDVRLQRLRQAVLQLLDAGVVLNAWTICHERTETGGRKEEQDNQEGRAGSGGRRRTRSVEMFTAKRPLKIPLKKNTFVLNGRIL